MHTVAGSAQHPHTPLRQFAAWLSRQGAQQQMVCPSKLINWVAVAATGLVMKLYFFQVLTAFGLLTFVLLPWPLLLL